MYDGKRAMRNQYLPFWRLLMFFWEFFWEAAFWQSHSDPHSDPLENAMHVRV